MIAAISNNPKTGSDLSQHDPVFDGVGLLAAILEVLVGPDEEPTAAPPATPELTPMRGARMKTRRPNYPPHHVPMKLSLCKFAKS